MNLTVDIPVLETERLRLRGMGEADLPMLIEIYGNENTARYIGGVKPRWQVWRQLATYVGHWAFRGFGFFCIEEKASGRAIGFCGPWEPDGWPEAEIGYGLLPAFHGKGYVTEAAVRSLQFAYGELGWKTAISFIDAENTPSEAVAKRLGAVMDGEGLLFGDEPANIWRHLPPDQFFKLHGKASS